MSDLHDEPKTAAAGQVAASDAAGGKPPASADTAALLSLIDRLGSLLERSELVELEVEAGETGILLRKPAALMPTATVGVTQVVAQSVGGTAAAPEAAEPAPSPAARSVKAPLTGIFYAASSPASPPFVSVGQHITIGQVIGLIEAMKLFNEIKSDQAGRVVRIVAESGKLVKAKQPLIEVEP